MNKTELAEVLTGLQEVKETAAANLADMRYIDEFLLRLTAEQEQTVAQQKETMADIDKMLEAVEKALKEVE